MDHLGHPTGDFLRVRSRALGLGLHRPSAPRPAAEHREGGGGEGRPAMGSGESWIRKKLDLPDGMPWVNLNVIYW